MYCCKDCGFEFLYADTKTERHNLDGVPFEKINVCPNCKGTNYEKVKKAHCRYCGRRISEEKDGYCNDYCKERGEILWEQQAKRRRMYEQSSLFGIVREIEEYNRTHKKKITYGEYIALKRGIANG